MRGTDEPNASAFALRGIAGAAHANGVDPSRKAVRSRTQAAESRSSADAAEAVRGSGNRAREGGGKGQARAGTFFAAEPMGHIPGCRKPPEQTDKHS